MLPGIPEDDGLDHRPPKAERERGRDSLGLGFWGICIER